jgi:hypothetical protein
MIAAAVRPALPRQVVDTEKAMVRAQLEETQRKEEADLYREVLGETGVAVDHAFDDSEQAERARDIYDGRKAPIERKYQERIREETRRIEDDYANKRRAQAVIAANLSRISPIYCFTYALSELSSTGAAEMDNFARQAQQFQETVKLSHYDSFEYKEYRLVNGNNTRSSTGFTRKEGYDPSNASIPQMSNYRHASLAGALSVCWVDIVLLLLFTVLFFAGAFAMFLRYDVR